MRNWKVIEVKILDRDLTTLKQMRELLIDKGKMNDKRCFTDEDRELIMKFNTFSSNVCWFNQEKMIMDEVKEELGVQ